MLNIISGAEYAPCLVTGSFGVVVGKPEGHGFLIGTKVLENGGW